MITAANLADYKQAILSAISAADKANVLDPYTKEDLISTVYVEALEHLATEGEVTAAWLKLTANHRTINLLKSAEWNRTESYEEWFDGDAIETVPPTLCDLDTPEGLYAVREFIQNASDEDREVIELLLQGWSQAEIAETLGVDVRAIARRIATMKEKLT